MKVPMGSNTLVYYFSIELESKQLTRTKKLQFCSASKKTNYLRRVQYQYCVCVNVVDLQFQTFALINYFALHANRLCEVLVNVNKEYYCGL